METILLRVLMITSICSLSAKHVYVRPGRTWKEAQDYCRDHFTELSPITNKFENQVFKRTLGWVGSGWIGLYKDPKSPTGWRWSGGANATYLNWQQTPQYDHAYWTWEGWYAGGANNNRNFFCLNLIVVEVKKSWEEALEHCRQNHASLTSLLSETENLLAKKVIQKAVITERVWIGLRYLNDRWMWVNDDPLVYEAWPQGGDQDHQCPTWQRCGALTREGLWENWDCQDELNFICI